MAERVHELKTWPSFFEAVLNGTKRHEIRRNDRDFAVGDVLHLREWQFRLIEKTPAKDTGWYTGRSLRARVTYVSPGGQVGIAADYVVMSIEACE